jgi:hypothetical protein
MERCIGGVHRGVLQTTHAPRGTCISYDRRVQEWGGMTRFRPRRQTSACGPAWIAFAWMQCGRGVLVHACRGMRRHPVRALLLVVGHQSENIADLLSPGYCYILQLICVDPASSARLLFVQTYHSRRTLQPTCCNDPAVATECLDVSFYTASYQMRIQPDNAIPRENLINIE